MSINVNYIKILTCNKRHPALKHARALNHLIYLFCKALVVLLFQQNADLKMIANFVSNKVFCHACSRDYNCTEALYAQNLKNTSDLSPGNILSSFI